MNSCCHSAGVASPCTQCPKFHPRQSVHSAVEEETAPGSLQLHTVNLLEPTQAEGAGAGWAVLIQCPLLPFKDVSFSYYGHLFQKLWSG